MITREYIAGFFDGEGSIGIYHRKNTGFHLRIQLTQNRDIVSKELFRVLVDVYGGNLSEQKTLSGGIKYNWQLNADKAVYFLEEIEPFLILKKTQAQIAIAWQKQRPEIIRGEHGRIMCKTPRNLDLDLRVSNIMKLLKKDIDIVMENQNDLVKILVELKPLAVIKG